jgi:hypothetical protein
MLTCNPLGLCSVTFTECNITNTTFRQHHSYADLDIGFFNCAPENPASLQDKSTEENSPRF